MAGTAEIELHGHRLRYRTAGHGPVLILVHGITSSSADWEPVLAQLARRFHVIAPDLLGHGDSAKPRGDYSLGATASLLRDLMIALGVQRATIVGHSFGGGIAMQMAYQFPERVERLVLVAAGGLGRQVSPMLRVVALPGIELVLPLLASDPVVKVGATVGGLMRRVGLRGGSNLSEVAVGLATLQDEEARRAFVFTTRSVVELGGQFIDATEKLYLAAAVPTLIVWGDRDRVIPARHGIRAHAKMPGSRLRIFEGAGHFPHHDDPPTFCATVSEFVEATAPSQPDDDALRRLLVEHAATVGADARPG